MLLGRRKPPARATPDKDTDQVLAEFYTARGEVERAYHHLGTAVDQLLIVLEHEQRPTDQGKGGSA